MLIAWALTAAFVPAASKGLYVYENLYVHASTNLYQSPLDLEVLLARSMFGKLLSSNSCPSSC